MFQKPCNDESIEFHINPFHLFRWWRILLIYVSGVAAGSLATSVTDPDVYLAGASGGVYALIAAHLANVIFNWGEMEFPGGQLTFTL